MSRFYGSLCTTTVLLLLLLLLQLQHGNKHSKNIIYKTAKMQSLIFHCY